MSSKKENKSEAHPQVKKQKRRKEQGSEVFFWVMLISFSTVLVSSLTYNAMAWKDPPVMVPIIDQIDIGRHNDRAGISFTRQRNEMFRVKAKFKFQYHDVDTVKVLFQSSITKDNMAIHSCKQPQSSQKIPEEYNFRAVHGKCIGKTMVQGDSSIAYALITESAISDRACKLLNDARPNISAQHIISCNPLNTNGNISGNVYESAMHLMKHGILSSECYPLLKEQIMGCEQKCDKKMSEIQIQDICALNGEAEIKQEILRNGPVIAEIILKSDFMTYKNGVYKYTPNIGVFQIVGNHVVKIVGWGITADTKYWIIENTWDEDWGDKGTAKIEMSSTNRIINGESAYAILIKKA